MKNTFTAKILEEKINTLWGTTIYGINFDLLRQSITLYVIHPSEKKNDFYELHFNNVSRVNFLKCASPLDWNYVELSEIYIKSAGLSFCVEIFLWDEEQKLYIECEGFEIL